MALTQSLRGDCWNAPVNTTVGGVRGSHAPTKHVSPSTRPGGEAEHPQSHLQGLGHHTQHARAAADLVRSAGRHPAHAALLVPPLQGAQQAAHTSRRLNAALQAGVGRPAWRGAAGAVLSRRRQLPRLWLVGTQPTVLNNPGARRHAPVQRAAAVAPLCAAHQVRDSRQRALARRAPPTYVLHRVRGTPAAALLCAPDTCGYAFHNAAQRPTRQATSRPAHPTPHPSHPPTHTASTSWTRCAGSPRCAGCQTAPPS